MGAPYGWPPTTTALQRTSDLARHLSYGDGGFTGQRWWPFRNLMSSPWRFGGNNR